MNVDYLTSQNAIRERLQTDAPWAVYALGDLAPAHFGRCRWLSPGPGSTALALLYSGFETPIFWALGAAAELAPLAPHLFASPQLILQIRPEIAPLVRAHYGHVDLHAMWRMALDARWFTPAAAGAGDRRLRPADLPALERLYEDGRAHGQQPDFFSPEMLAGGVFFGAWQAGELVAVAGTHIVSVDESAAAIGNVYTRRDSRRRGHAARLTSQVAAALTALGVRTIALSVRQSNPAAVSVYARLGFTAHCEFFEGFARRAATLP